MDYIEKIQKLKAIAKLKAELHKQNLIDAISSKTVDNDIVSLVDNSISMVNAATNIYHTLQDFDQWSQKTDNI